ncbi:excisionase family DNA-binding protein [Carnobacterium gallinarum]|uniref:excisionase family DNA-binding protein n=1 Tax=Carnobacterium gallinarum TaxID=2749 RepID=UPI000AACC2AD|nr:excisionase family DNA-binding protein [Carnobacterium gallinarum]
MSMYLTIEETADYLAIPTNEVLRFIRERQIRTVTDGENILIYKEQFNLFMKEMERYKKELEDYLSEPIPEDIDIKDED